MTADYNRGEHDLYGAPSNVNNARTEVLDKSN